MLEEKLFNLLTQGKESLGIQSKKFTGALAIELLRHAFERHGIQTSQPNVYLKGLPFEFDLAIPRKGASPEFGILYSLEDILAVLEIKASGLYSKMGLSRISLVFREIQANNPSIFCGYVTLSERKSYKYKATEENLGFPVYTFAWHQGPDKKRKYETTGDFPRLIRDLKNIVNNSTSLSKTTHNHCSVPNE